MSEIRASLKDLCFNCGRNISSSRLNGGFPCEEDLSESEIKEIREDYFLEDLYKILERKNRLYNFKKLYEIERESKEFFNFFYNVIGSEPWSIQIAWFKRLIKNNSFAMIAPTGTGKSTFIAVSSIYFSKKGKKILIILPTKVLVTQMYERIHDYMEKLKISLEVLMYSGKKEEKKRIEEGNFDILILSNQFISKNFSVLKDKKFDFIFIDDVDAFFKGSKNIEKVLMLLGFSEEDISIAKEVIDLKLKGKFDFKSKLREELENIKKKDHGTLILSSATGSVRGKRVKLYKELLDFSVGTGVSKLRNIVDTFIEDAGDFKEKVLELVKKMEDGILIFVSKEYGTEYAKDLYNFLLENGIKVGLVISKEKSSLDNIKKFSSGEINVLIGMAHHHGLLVRGLDLPTRVKYAIFIGIPKISINITKYERNLRNLLILSNVVKDLVEEKPIIDRLIKSLNRKIKRLSSEAIVLLSNAYSSGENIEDWMEYILRDVYELEKIVMKYIKDPDFLKKLDSHPSLSLRVKGEDIYLNIVDIKTYIQASGRTSRLYAGGLTKGLSVILSDDDKLLRALDARLRIYFYY
ncbi:MAG: reverse gyrase [Candidatus Nanoclepta minutus]|uniref:Reverse gyrase n=1 Tax=Candidatus Nanoclepta minutus TaxID=1940235 RepID=A0A397WMK4_9ARCH|nr:MAG: reverse gyrase [Candidatus Nanoclepta minutus]